MLPTNRHVVFFGRTQTGKTFTAEVYSAGIPVEQIAVKLDTKGETSERMIEGKQLWGNVPNEDVFVCTTLEEFREEIAHRHREDGYRFYIYEPVISEMNKESYSDFFDICYASKRVTIIVDEVLSITPNAHTIPDGYLKVLTRGAFIHVQAYSCSQRPSGISQHITANSSYFFVFDLTKKADRQRIVDDTDAEEFINEAGYRQFWYWEVGWRNAKLARLKLN